MIGNYLKVSLRNLIRHKTFSLINILGFAFGISVCLLIVLFLIKEYSYDSYNVNAPQIYKLVDMENNTSAIDYRVAPAILNNYPEVKNVCVAYIVSKSIGTSYNNTGYNIVNVMSVNNAFFEMFSTRFVCGNQSMPLPTPNSVVLTESSAHKLFGNENPIGKVIVMWRRFPLTVTGVIKDFPDNSTINANMIVNIENNSFKFSRFEGNSKDSSTYRYPFNIYLQLREKANAFQLVNKVNSNSEILHPYIKKVGLISLTDLYLHDNSTGGTTKKGNPALLRLFTGIALLVLILAIINYINLSVAQQNKRNKEIGIRKTIGASRKSIVFLFLTESFLITCVAFTVALVITEITLPFFASIVDSHLSTRVLIQFPWVIVLFLSIILTGILSGIVPAVLFSSFNPVKVFSGKMFVVGRKDYFRNLLIVFQFTASIVLIFSIIVIERQINFAKHNDLGFDKEQLLCFDLPFTFSDEDISKVNVLTNKLSENPTIKNISASQCVPGDVHFSMGSRIEGKEKFISCIFADSNFINTFDIQLMKGRELHPGDYGQACMINETAFKYFGWDDLKNKRINSGKEGGYEVIGVVKDFHVASLHQPIEPACIIFDIQHVPPSSISLRISKGATRQTMAYLQKVWKEVFPDFPMNYQFYDEWFNQMYREDDRFGDAIGLFALLAVSISCLGILGMAVYSSERRAKEIGIRKVHGASTRQLMGLLNKDLMKWVIVAFAIACPIGWYAMNKWLQDFAYRTEISWWIFMFAGMVALIVALLTVSWQTWRTATRNPVESLRYE
jgi:putative ABC transport system permease protein